MRRTLAVAVAVLTVASAVIAVRAGTVTDRTKGRILLDVGNGGDAWYVSPVSGLRYRLGSPTEALDVMRTFGVGIDAADLSRVAPGDAAGPSDPSILPYVQGRILLDVGNGGDAWYVDPGDGRRYPLGTPQQAYRTMTSRGLGISSADLAKVAKGTVRGPFVQRNVPFTSQAPYGNWQDPRQNSGCEEAVAYMAVSWARGKGIDPASARAAIVAASDYERATYGVFQDTSASDTANRIFRGFFHYDDVKVTSGIGPGDILSALRDGDIVAVGVNARLLGNPWFSQPAPLQHMILVVGYDPLADAFIVHDPGTAHGADLRYGYDVMGRALLDYSTGYDAPITGHPTAMIAIGKKTRSVAAAK